MGLLFGTCMSSFVLCCNVAIVIIGAVIHSGYRQGDHIADLMYGRAPIISRWSTVLHLLINVASTVLLGASNYTMQVLCSPTRLDINKAHTTSNWLDVGLLSFRNLRAIPRKRAALSLILAFSSIPLHLFYNAAIFQIATFNEYSISIVGYMSPEFFKLNTTSPDYLWRFTDNRHWKRTYDTEYVSEHGDLFLVVDEAAFSITSSHNPLNMSEYWPIEIQKGQQATIRNVTKKSNDWISFEVFAQNAQKEFTSSYPTSVHVEKAFAKVVQPQSRIQISLDFMIVVIVFNALKLAIMVWVLTTDKNDYLVTLGDAVSSFLERPDPITRRQCMLDKENMLMKIGQFPYHVKGEEEIVRRRFDERSPGKWLPQTQRYFASLGKDRQMIFAILFGITVSANIIMPFFGGLGDNYAEMRSWGTSSDDILPFGSNPILNAWIVNLPQLILSFSYIVLNGICTSMASAEEWNNFARTRKGLRVTKPSGAQRSTHFLQLPYKWAIPLLITSTALHWLLSQSFFLVRLDVINREKVVVPESSKSACGFSRLSLWIFFVVALILVCAIGLVGLRRMKQKIPFAASCSLVISAACHPVTGEVEPHLKDVKWGVVGEEVESGFAHCCITSMHTLRKELVRGRIYR